ncbi:tetratricopeptide repeat-containing response regulator [Corallincola holothuriorum]|nr:tetratricopeptide repeat-containing response regulator [Corallincola holothuriorum]
MANANSMTAHFQRYSKRRFLVIDDFSEFRMTVKKMLEEFGAKQIDLASNAEDAFELYSEHRHDVVISDFNLGDGKDGQQLLEELSQLGILRRDTLYLMASAENSLHMVMGALECRPDDYLTKPFTKTTLHTRIDRLLAKKQLLSPLLKALDEKNYPLAEQLANRLIQTEPKARATSLRYLTEIYVAQQKWTEARHIFNAAVETRPLLWAQLGLVECDLAENKAEEALTSLDPLLEANPLAVQAWDLKARALEMSGDLSDAQAALQQAIHLSPRSLCRLRNAIRLAQKNSDLDGELRYFRLLTKLAKTSALKTPDDFIQRQQVLLKKIQTSSGLNKKKVAAELQTALKEDQKLYPSSMLMLWSIALARTQAALLEEKYAAAKESFQRLKKELLPSLNCIQETSFLTQISDVCEQLKETEMQEAIATQINIVANSTEEKCTDNVLALKEYKKGNFKEAIRFFNTAHQQHPNSITIAINLAQALLKHAETATLTRNEKLTCKSCLALSRRLPDSDARAGKVQQLIQRYANLRESE